MEQKKKNDWILALIYIVIFTAYSISVFLLFKDWNTVFWVSYGFMLAAYVIHITCIFSIIKSNGLKSAFFGVPLGMISIFFLLAELISSIAFMIYRDRADIKVAIAVQTVLLCALIAASLAAIMVKNTIQSASADTKRNVISMKGVQADIEILLHRNTDPETGIALKKLSETIRYSDPMSTQAVMTQEEMIMSGLEQLRTSFDTGDMPGVREWCSKIELLFAERHKMLLLSK